jgi:hypothetical protein
MVQFFVPAWVIIAMLIMIISATIILAVYFGSKY